MINKRKLDGNLFLTRLILKTEWLQEYLVFTLRGDGRVKHLSSGAASEFMNFYKFPPCTI